jgi:hypothetical protein
VILVRLRVIKEGARRSSASSSWLGRLPVTATVLSVEILKPDLAGSWSVEEQVLDLLSIEVTVLVKCCENDDIASGERA